MTNNRIISAIYNYKEVTNRFIFVPYLFAHEQPIWASFIHFFTANQYIKYFVNQWASGLDYTWLTVLEGFSNEKESHQWLMYLLQGTTETISYPIMTSPEIIFRENWNFSHKVLKMIDTIEKFLWKLLQRERFLAPKARILSFDKLIMLLQEHELRLAHNSLTLYSQLELIINTFGTAQLKAEFKETMKELRIWIKNNLSA